MIDEERDGEDGRQRPQHTRTGSYVRCAGKAKHHEPDRRDRPEDARDVCRAEPLHREHTRKDRKRQRHDVRIECRRHHFEAENKIELQSGSHVEGDIKTKRLVIDEGVFFEGNCSMGAGNRKTPPPAAAPVEDRQPETLKK